MIGKRCSRLAIAEVFGVMAHFLTGLTMVEAIPADGGQAEACLREITLERSE